VAKHKFIESKYVRRAKRVLAFGIASGIVSPGAGSWIGIDAVTSAIFGAMVVLLSLVAAMLLTYAGKGEITDTDFDSHINESIETLKSSAKKDK
jgi:hypothetical protein